MCWLAPSLGTPVCITLLLQLESKILRWRAFQPAQVPENLKHNSQECSTPSCLLLNNPNSWPLYWFLAYTCWSKKSLPSKYPSFKHPNFKDFETKSISTSTSPRKLRHNKQECLNHQLLLNNLNTKIHHKLLAGFCMHFLVLTGRSEQELSS